MNRKKAMSSNCLKRERGREREEKGEIEEGKETENKCSNFMIAMEQMHTA